MSISVIGPLIAPWHVEQAVLSTVQQWLDTYLAEVERQSDLKVGSMPRPPAADSYFGGTDFDSWQQDMLPVVVAVVQPTGPPEFLNPAYSQTYEVEVGVQTIRESEDETRQFAGLYAAAVMGALDQHGGLGGFAQRTKLVSAPGVRFPDPDDRTNAYGTVAFHVTVETILNEQGGVPIPPTPAESAPPDPVTVVDAEVDLTAEPLGY